MNSYNLYKLSVPNPTTHFKYRQSVVDSLVSSHLTIAPPRVGRPRKHLHDISEDPERYNLQLGHFPKRGDQKQCVVCSNTREGTRKRTSFFCKGCPSTPSLYPDGCFEKYHTP